jgi:single-stranded-DNA-specific exonuclease
MQSARWVLPQSNEGLAQRLQAEIPCPAIIANLLAVRGITSAEAARSFLAPTLDDLHDPNLMLGVAAAVLRIQQAVADAEPILIYGDYDVDGTTATVLLKTAIERIGTRDTPAQVSYHVPHRLREGYGIQNVRLAEAAAAGVRLEARAVINPAQPGCPYPNKHLCGAGVAFKLAHALLAAHATNETQHNRLRNSLLPSFLKLVAIATIADSVELTGENRAIVWLGLRELSNPVQPGLRALMQVARIALDKAPTAREIGFGLAPRINAAGRMDIASDVVELFLTRDPAFASQLAEKLDQLNQDRRATEAAALEAIEMQLLTLRDAAGTYTSECIVLDHPEWHRGVLGILASRVVDRTGRPALVMTTEDGDAHGSGRSIGGFHLLDALTAVHDSPTGDGLFKRFGGHAHAVGFSLSADRLDLLRERMRTHSNARLTPDLLIPEIECDLELTPADLSHDLVEWLERCQPFGMGNPEPQFIARGFVLSGPPRVIKETHICLPLIGPGVGRPLNAMGWSRAGKTSWADRCAELGLEQRSKVDAVFRLRENKHPQYGGLELELVDLAVVHQNVS